MMKVTQFSCLAILFYAFVLLASLRRAAAKQINGSDIESDVESDVPADKDWNSGIRVERSPDSDAVAKKLEIRLKQINQVINRKIDWGYLTGTLASAARDISYARLLAYTHLIEVDLGPAKYSLDGKNLLQEVLEYVIDQWGLQYKAVRSNSDVAYKNCLKLKRILAHIRKDYENDIEQSAIESFENISILARETMQKLRENLGQFKKAHLMIREILVALPKSTQTAEVVELMKNFTIDLDLNVHTWGHMISMIQFVQISSNIASTYYTKSLSMKSKGGRQKGGSGDADKLRTKKYIFQTTFESQFVVYSSLGTLAHHLELPTGRYLIDPLIKESKQLDIEANRLDELYADAKDRAQGAENEYRTLIEGNIPKFVKKMRKAFADATLEK